MFYQEIIPTNHSGNKADTPLPIYIFVIYAKISLVLGNTKVKTMGKTVVMGVQLNHRNETATKFQEIITQHGCTIKTRVGLHKVEGNICSASGIILLELVGEDEDVATLEQELKSIDGINIQKMTFTD